MFVRRDAEMEMENKAMMSIHMFAMTRVSVRQSDRLTDCMVDCQINDVSSKVDPPSFFYLHWRLTLDRRQQGRTGQGRAGRGRVSAAQSLPADGTAESHSREGRS